MKKFIISIFAMALLCGNITASAAPDDQTKKEQAKKDTKDMKEGKVPRTMTRKIHGLDKAVQKKAAEAKKEHQKSKMETSKDNDSKSKK